MGWQLYAGKESINWTAGAKLICNWILNSSVPLDKKGREPSGLYDISDGNIYISHRIASWANNDTPLDFENCKLDGLIQIDISEQEFYQCRAFLEYAVKNGHDIHGSF